MKQEKWDKLHKELDDALDSEFGKAKLALRKYISDNKEKVTKDLEQMRELSNRDKQEPLEEVAANLADPNLCKTDNWIAGAKWQAERSYSEEKVRNTLLDINLVNPSHLQMTSNGHGEFPDGYKLTQKGVDYIIEQFKKKYGK